MIPLLFVRYSPGACGTFLLTMLQTSPRVACWNPELEALKGTPEFANAFFSWFRERFQSNLGDHLKHEPHHPYQLDFFSAKFPRGDDVTESGFVDCVTERDDQLLLDNIKQGRITAMRLNKSSVPKFGYGNNVINVVNDCDSLRWLHRTRWIKLFGREFDHFISKENHPEYLRAKFKKLQFNNPYQFHAPWIRFARDHIINEPVMQVFRDPKRIIEHASNAEVKQHWINLSDVLTPRHGFRCIVRWFDVMDLGEPDLELLASCYQHYFRTNILPLAKYL